jgi:folate-binding protein YgfZ
MTDNTEPVVLHVAEPLVLSPHELTAYNALRTGASWFELAPLHVSKFVGAGAGGALNGLVTNDVTKLAVGRGMYAAALTPKGKLLADLAILRTEPETFLVVTSESAGAEWFAMVRKYINPRLARYSNESDAIVPVGVYGPDAAAILARIGGATGGGAMLTDSLSDALHVWSEWTHGLWKVPGADARLIRAPYLGSINGFVLLLDSAVADTVRAQLTKLGAAAASTNVWAMCALESGRPVFGLDMDATTLPQEANLDDWSAISFEKGCYTGQETVARIHFRGHVNKHLRAVRSDHALPLGTTLQDESGKSVGDVRRSGVSPTLGALAIAMVRREVPDGARVNAIVDGVSVEAHVTDLVTDKSAPRSPS